MDIKANQYKALLDLINKENKTKEDIEEIKRLSISGSLGLYAIKINK